MKFASASERQKSRCLFKSLAIISFLSIVGNFCMPNIAGATTIDDLEEQKAAAQQKANALKQQAAEKQQNINSINDLIEKLTKEISSYQAQIVTTQRNITSNEKNIKETENLIQVKQAELEANMAKQAQAIQTMYVMGRKSTIENFLASDSLSQAMARQQYLTSLSEKIESMMEEIKQLKAELEAKKTSLEQRRTELAIQKEQLTAYQATIVAQKQQQNTLLNGAQSEKQAILAAARQANDEIKSISAAIYAERLKLSSNESVSVGGSGYPYSAIGAVDPWGFYTRQCTSYAAWYWNMVLGRKWHRVAGYGNAWGWPQAADENGVAAHKTPQVNAIISWGKIPGTMPYGHVAIVHKINDDGTIDISEYNYIAPDVYSYRSNVNPAVYGSYSYIY